MEIPGIPAPLLTALSRSGVGPVALVGGAVRDLLLHRLHNDPWRGLPDLDLVVQGRASELVKELVDALAGQLGEGVVQRCQEHGAYGTVELELNLDGQQVLLDVATARCETYPVPAENPQVSFGSLADDLARRDFSINAMALDLVSGTLLDPHGGQADLELRQLRFLHHGSVRDDPTRLVRGARYAARLGLELDGASADQAAATLAQWPWPWRQGDPPAEAPSALGTRLRMELELLLEREPWLAALGALQAGARQPLALAERLQLPHRQHRLLAQWLELRRRLVEQQLEGSLALPEHWCALLEASGCSPEAVALALACGSGPRRPLLRWLLRWRQVKAELTAADLLAAGMRQGPELGQRLRELRAERLGLERI